MKLVTAQEMRSVDNQAIKEYGIPSIILMENAGLRVVELIAEISQNTKLQDIVILAGKGNNGGDGLVAARHLINSGFKVKVFLIAQPEELTVDAATNFFILERMSANIRILIKKGDLDKLHNECMTADLIVDAIFGTGFKGKADDFIAAVIKSVNMSKAQIVAVDIPSGVEADTGKVYGEAIKADYTITLVLPKIGLLLEPGTDYVGNLSVVDISIPPKLKNNPQFANNIIDHDLVKSLLPRRQSDSHKGNFGHALLIGGSKGMMGAIQMSSLAALRAGAGLVTAALPKSMLPALQSSCMELMVKGLEEDSTGKISNSAQPLIKELLHKTNVCAIGPGMGTNSDAAELVRFVLAAGEQPVVIDADGINALQGKTQLLLDAKMPVVITPHPGEMARLTGLSIADIQAQRIDVARKFAQEWKVIIVLKGHKTIVAGSQGEIFVNLSGNQGMATAGSGDVLTGIITSFIAQGLKPFAAAVAGVYIHGLSGDIMAHKKSQRALIAGDLIAGLGEAFLNIEGV